MESLSQLLQHNMLLETKFKSNIKWQFEVLTRKLIFKSSAVLPNLLYLSKRKEWLLRIKFLFNYLITAGFSFDFKWCACNGMQYWNDRWWILVYVTDNQPFDCTTFVWEVLMSCACLWAMAFPYFNYLCREPDVAEVGTIFNVSSYDMVRGRHSNLSHPLRRVVALRVEPRSLVYNTPPSSYRVATILKSKS